jgi:cytochrome c oxidase subunit 1
MSRRVATYMPEFRPYHILSSVGGFIQLAGFLLMAGFLIYSLFRGRHAPANPWGGATLEWACPSPPPVENFETQPTVGEPYDQTGLTWDKSVGGYMRRKPS